jgi:hypothetical protein
VEVDRGRRLRGTAERDADVQVARHPSERLYALNRLQEQIRRTRRRLPPALPGASPRRPRAPAVASRFRPQRCGRSRRACSGMGRPGRPRSRKRRRPEGAAPTKSRTAPALPPVPRLRAGRARVDGAPGCPLPAPRGSTPFAKPCGHGYDRGTTGKMMRVTVSVATHRSGFEVPRPGDPGGRCRCPMARRYSRWSLPLE